MAGNAKEEALGMSVVISADGGAEVRLEPEDRGAPADGGTGAPPAAGEAAPRGGDELGAEDEEGSLRHGAEGEELDAQPGDERLSVEEREAVRARRRLERKARREHQREREQALRRELAARDRLIEELAGRLQIVERKTTGSELAQLDSAIEQAESAATQYKTVIAEATKQQNGDVIADATEKMLIARNRAEELRRLRANFVRSPVVARGSSAISAPNPEVIRRAAEWSSKNRWYDPRGQDVDSRITLMLDDQLTQEGYNPATDEYWEELTERVQRYLPHRLQRANGGSNSGNGADTGSRSSTGGGRPLRPVVTGSGREGALDNASGVRTYRLSPERVQALKEAGIWDDPKARAEAIRRYQDYDRQNTGS